MKLAQSANATWPAKLTVVRSKSRFEETIMFHNIIRLFTAGVPTRGRRVPSARTLGLEHLERRDAPTVGLGDAAARAIVSPPFLTVWNWEIIDDHRCK